MLHKIDVQYNVDHLYEEPGQETSKLQPELGLELGGSDSLGLRLWKAKIAPGSTWNNIALEGWGIWFPKEVDMCVAI